MKEGNFIDSSKKLLEHYSRIFKFPGKDKTSKVSQYDANSSRLEFERSIISEVNDCQILLQITIKDEEFEKVQILIEIDTLKLGFKERQSNRLENKEALRAERGTSLSKWVLKKNRDGDSIESIIQTLCHHPTPSCETIKEQSLKWLIEQQLQDTNQCVLDLESILLDEQCVNNATLWLNQKTNHNQLIIDPDGFKRHINLKTRKTERKSPIEELSNKRYFHKIVFDENEDEN